MSYDPTKRVEVLASDIRKARFWYEFKLYLKVVAILAFPTALALWALIEWLG